MATNNSLSAKMAKNGKVTITFNIDKDGKESSSGKSMVHYTTGGFADVEGSEGMRVSLSMIKKK